MVLETGALGGEALLVPAGVALRPEEVGPHVVVHAVDGPAESVEIANHFRSDEAVRPGDQHLLCGFHVV